ncbi:cysteine desulfurase [Anaerosporomusa subterranea]|uniref:cysteine desulfurase n=1 Tax=Anaerosporomusa subterranea TaxID=1794912 RepID=A0A154BPB5_ANASB|nr:aminotransferase class V-fold PLP-dependent enzyme [Anaerosporomusa subterranea]KYZ75725.1 cysteine desulfurase [Anaerosporomusa subterranea]
MIYLDNAATSWPKPEAVYQAVDSCLRSVGGSPGRGGHSMAMLAGRTLFEAREEIAALWGVTDSSRISFTANATDAINTALAGCITAGDTVVTTSMEHNAVARPLRYLETKGIKLRIIPCQSDGSLPLDLLKAALADSPKALVMAHASNVTGGIMPLEDVSTLLPKGTLFIVDAAQTAGVEHIQVEALGIDLLAASGHKGLLGPQGTGCLYVKPGLKLKPYRYGGTGSVSESDIQPDFMPDCLESGTQNTPGIAGLREGVRFIRATGIEKVAAQEKEFAVVLARALQSMDGVRVLGWSNPKLQTAVVSAVFSRFDSGWFAQRLAEEYGIASRAGLQCAPWAHRTLGTLASGVVRFSPGFFNSSQEIEQTIKACRALLKT